VTVPRGCAKSRDELQVRVLDGPSRGREFAPQRSGSFVEGSHLGRGRLGQPERRGDVAGWFHRLALATLALAVLVVPPASAQASLSAQQQLAEKYSPVLSLEPQPRPCGPGEAYRPTSVDIVLASQDVLLRDPSGNVAKRAPTAGDLWRHAKGYYVDLPGDPLNPGCGYERQFRAWYDGRKPSVYAHLATDRAYPGKLAVEYWFYYTFNDFTDKHESDWEMAQVDFDAPDAAEALLKGPYEVDLSQHAGGERSSWTDTKLEKQGTHPVIYDATGSHANYFGSGLYLGRGAREGFGCDDTRTATTRLQLQTVLLPDVPSSPSAPYAWLAFGGRWGQQEPGINNGPTGPASKPQWSAPILWAAGLRNTSLELPGGRTFGVSVGNFFCDAVTGGAIVLNWSLIHPVPFVALLLLALGGLLGAAVATTWRPPDAHPLRRRRQGGLVAVRAGVHARRPLCDGIAPPQLPAGQGALVADVRLHHSRRRTRDPLRPTVRRRTAPPDRPLPQLHQPRGRARLHAHGPLRRDPAHPLLLRPRGPRRRPTASGVKTRHTKRIRPALLGTGRRGLSKLRYDAMILDRAASGGAPRA
jgi:hypothetical protein